MVRTIGSKATYKNTKQIVEIVKVVQAEGRITPLYLVKYVTGKWTGMEFRANGSDLR